MSQALLSSAYFGPVQWFQKLHRYDRCLIERYDNYVKQTYRNRCVIAATGGPQTLTVPIERYDGNKCLMRDIRISDHGAWRHVHWNAIVSSYGESPFSTITPTTSCLSSNAVGSICTISIST